MYMSDDSEVSGNTERRSTWFKPDYLNAVASSKKTSLGVKQYVHYMYMSDDNEMSVKSHSEKATLRVVQNVHHLVT